MRAAIVFAGLACGAPACYRGPAAESATCRLACTDRCPDGLQCVGGYCVGGDTRCGLADAPPPPPPDTTCGMLGAACCAAAPACPSGAYCSTGTCMPCVVNVALGRRHACMLV